MIFNLSRRLLCRLLDGLCRGRCPWQRLWLNKDFVAPEIPGWVNRLFNCDCQYHLPAYNSSEVAYQQWLWRNSFLGCMEKRQRQRQLRFWRYQPLISIVLPVYKVELPHLQECLSSVVQQLYPHWQLCIVEDNCQLPAIQAYLQDFKQRYPDRVKLVLHEKNLGIAKTSQEAIHLATGEFIALLDHDDVLAPEALFETVKLLNKHPDTDWIYSDNDKLDVNGQHCCYHSKPDWSPELLLTYNYILHLSVIRRELLKSVGGFQAAFEGSQDHDLYLRLAEQTNRVKHIRRVLYSWRQSPDSVASTPDNKRYAFDAALNALNAALMRRKELGKAIFPEHSWLGSYQIIREVQKMPNLAVVQFQSTHLANASRTSDIHGQRHVTLQSIVNNVEPQNGVRLADLITACSADYLLIIAQGITLQDDNDLYRLVTQLQPEGVAGATVKILNAVNRVDHCGLAFQNGEIIYPLRGWERDWAGHGAYGALVRNVSVVSPLLAVFKTSALKPLAFRIAKFQQIETTLVAMCFELLANQQRLIADGGIIGYCANQEPYHFIPLPCDAITLKNIYGKYLKNDDPYYHGEVH